LVANARISNFPMGEVPILRRIGFINDQLLNAGFRNGQAPHRWSEALDLRN
jgi:hypothetical protein